MHADLKLVLHYNYNNNYLPHSSHPAADLQVKSNNAKLNPEGAAQP